MLPRIQCSIEQGSKFSVKGDLYVERKKKKKDIAINIRCFTACHVRGKVMKAVSYSLRVKINLGYIFYQNPRGMAMKI